MASPTKADAAGFEIPVAANDRRVIYFTKSAGQAGYAGVLSLLRERGPGRVPDPPFATTGTALHGI
jgi:hypothetical protein